MKSKYVVNSLWIDRKIDTLQAICINSFLKNGFEFNLYTYNTIVNLPAGVKIMDGNAIIESSFVFRDCKDSYATFSDWFRIKLLYEVGGWWVDCDVLCLKKFKFKQSYVFATEYFHTNELKFVRICNAVIKMPRNSKIGKIVLSKINERLEKGDFNNINWTEIGARILGEVIISENLDRLVVSPATFCPNDYFDYKDLVEKENMFFSDESCAIHLWNKMWEWNNLNPIIEAKEGSFLKEMISRFSQI